MYCSFAISEVSKIKLRRKFFGQILFDLTESCQILTVYYFRLTQQT